MNAPFADWQIDDLQSVAERVRLIEDSLAALAVLLVGHPAEAATLTPLIAALACLTGTARCDLDAELVYAATTAASA